LRQNFCQFVRVPKSTGKFSIDSNINTIKVRMVDDDSSYCQGRRQKNFQGKGNIKTKTKKLPSLPPIVHFISGG